MNTTDLSQSTQMLFALLRSSLHEREVEIVFFQHASHDDWKKCYELASTQGVMALAWDGIMKLPRELFPPRTLRLTWGMAVEKYEDKYLRYCCTVNELSEFYRKHGITTVQLKGVGFSTYYPVPSHREGGDIDIYTYSSDKDKMSDTAANALADKLMQQLGIEVDSHSYKHSNFYYKGIPIENHKLFVNVRNIKEAVLANELLIRDFNPQEVALAEGRVLIPSPAFNTLFIAFHAMQHYGKGLALHHLCDWAMILKHHGVHFSEEITYKCFLQGVAAMTQLCNLYLGTSVAVSGGEKLADEMLTELVNPPYSSIVPTKNKLGIIIYKTRRLFHEQKLKSKVFNESLMKRLWISVSYHIRKPESIFSRTQI